MNLKPPFKRPLTTEELLAMSDDDIDYSDIPELDEEWFRNAEVIFPQAKRQMTLRLDGNVVDWFRAKGKGYQSRMNAVLRAYVEAQIADEGKRAKGAADAN